MPYQTITTSYGRAYEVVFLPIDFPIEQASNCVLIVGKDDDGVKVIDVVDVSGYGVTSRTYFAAWGNTSDDGSFQHYARQLGADVYGVISCADEIEVRHLTQDLRDVYKVRI